MYFKQKSKDIMTPPDEILNDYVLNSPPLNRRSRSPSPDPSPVMRKFSQFKPHKFTKTHMAGKYIFAALFGLLAVSVLVAQGFYEIAKNRVEKVDNTYEKKVSFFTRLKNIPNTFDLRL